MIDIGTLAGRITLDDQGSAALKAFHGNLTDIGGSMTKAGTTLTLGLTAPLVAAAGASLMFSSNFEASMTRLVSLAGVSSDELEGVKQHILDLAPAVGIGPQALADAMTKISSTTEDTVVALQILDIAAKGSAAGMGAAVDVAGSLTAVINSYGAQNITAARAADILTKSVQLGGAEAKELAPVLANVVPIAAQMGVSFEEVGANIATLTKLGVPAAEAVTQLSSVFSALLKETKQGGDALASVGMSYAGLRQEVKDKGLTDSLIHLSEAFKGNETGLTDVFGRIEALRNVMGTAGQQAGTYRDVLDQIKTSTGTLDAATKAMESTQVHTWNSVKAALEVAAIQFGDALAPALVSVLEVIKPLIGYLSEAVKWFTSLPVGVQNAAIAFGAFAAAAGPIIFIAGTLVSSFVALAPLLPIAGAAFAALTGPIGLLALAITGVTAAVVLFKRRTEELGKTNIGQPLKDNRDEYGHLKIAIQDVDGELKKLDGTMQGPLQNGFKLTVDSMKNVFSATTEATTATGAHVVKTKEQIEAADELAKQLRAIRTDWDLAARDVGKLTDAQKTSIDKHLELEHRVQDIAKVMGISEVAVEDYAKAYDTLPARIKALADEAVRLKPILEVMGLKEAREHAVSLWMTLEDTGEVAQETGAILEDELTPGVVMTGVQFKESTDRATEHRSALMTVGGAASGLAKDFVDLAQIGGDSFAEIGRVVGSLIKVFDMTTAAVEEFEKAQKAAAATASGVSAASYIALSATVVGAGVAIGAMIAQHINAQREVRRLAAEQAIADRIAKEWNATTKLTADVWKTATNEFEQAMNVIDALGGVSNMTTDEVKKLTAELLHAIAALADPNFSGPIAADAMELLNKHLAELGQTAIDSGGLVSKEFLELVQATRDWGVEVEGLNQLLLGQLNSAASGLNTLLGGMSKALGDNLSLTQSQVTGLGAAAAATFAEMIERGMSYKDALDALQPAIDILRDNLEKTGLDGGDAFDFLIEMSRIAHDEFMGPLADAITGANQALMGLHNAGILDQTMFTGLEQTAMDAYNKIIAGGADGNAALMMMQPTLQTLWALHKDYGFTVDDATQALLDEAEAQGKVGDRHRPIAEQMLLATNMIRDAVVGLAKVFGVDLPDSTDKAGASIKSLGDKAITAMGGATTSVQNFKAELTTIPTNIDVTITAHGSINTDQSLEAHATGGLVGHATGGTILQGPWVSGYGSDTTMIAATPGEGVVTTEAMDRIGTSGLAAINSGDNQEIAALRKDVSIMTRAVKDLARANKVALQEAILMLPSKVA